MSPRIRVQWRILEAVDDAPSYNYHALQRLRALLGPGRPWMLWASDMPGDELKTVAPMYTLGKDLLYSTPSDIVVSLPLILSASVLTDSVSGMRGRSLGNIHAASNFAGNDGTCILPRK